MCKGKSHLLVILWVHHDVPDTMDGIVRQQHHRTAECQRKPERRFSHVLTEGRHVHEAAFHHVIELDCHREEQKEREQVIGA